MNDWHRLDPSDVLRKLGTDLASGLSSREAALRLEKLGPNSLIERRVKTPWKILLEQLSSRMVLILIAAAGISALLRDFTDAAAILVIVALNTFIGFTQENRAEKAMLALKALAVPRAKVRRDGQVKEIASSQLVPGDILYLEAGNLVPADARVIEAVNLRVQESALTGESEPVEKIADPLPDPELPLADRRNMVFRGTVVSYGRGRALITETGMVTQLGRIAAMIESGKSEPTPLQKRLDSLGNRLALAVIAIAGIIFALGLLRGEKAKDLFLTAVSLAVAAVPEGLPAVVTVALALGAQSMLRKRALIRKLPAVEALGLGVEPAEKDVMRRPPYPPAESILSRGLGLHALWVGILMTAVALGTGAWYWALGREHWRTVLFTTLAFSQMGHVLAIRSERDSFFRTGLFSNKWLLGAVAGTFSCRWPWSMFHCCGDP